MDGQLRRVRKLRLRSAEEALNRRGAILIEDALRTASLPDGDGSRLLVVRRLPLGRIRASEPPSAIGLRIEARCRELAALAVPAESPEAAAAPAVLFDDDLEPYTALALRLARGEEVTAWFWPLAARGWTPAMPRHEAMLVMLAGALACSAGAAAALVLVRVLLRNGVLDPLLSALRYQDGGALLEAFGWEFPTTVPGVLGTGQVASPPDAPSEVSRRAAAPWFFGWGAEDPRSVWLACALWTIERPAAAGNSQLPHKASAWIEAVCSHLQVVPSSEVSLDHLRSSLRPALPFDDVEPLPRTAAVESTPATLLPPPCVGEGESLQRMAKVKSTPTTLPRRPEGSEVSALDGGRRGEARWLTSRGGLFFLVPAMERLGMASWLAEHPLCAEWSIPWLILRAIAARLGTPDDDPVFRCSSEPLEEPPDEVRQEIRHWIRRLQRSLRRTARLGLSSLVFRTGRLVFTETHIDVLFRLDAADIRVRRAGLDIDPGWASWLGRVVHFHYVGDEAYDE
jgi:hypothetical protein